jgi:glycosyltransferase involved in cell wall biosynthesis
VTLRVLHIITRLTLGGSSESTVASVETLARAGHDVTLAVGLAQSERATVEDARQRGCRLIDIPALDREASPVRDLAALASLTRLMVRIRPAIVHTHTSKAGFIGRLAARLARVPAVIHQPHGHVFYAYWGPVRTGLYLRLERLAARWTDRIVTLTDRGAAEHLARGVGRADRYVTIPSGVPIARLRAEAPSRDEARHALGLPPDAYVIVAVGRLVPVKGFDVLIDALPAVAAAVPELRVALVGDGPERDVLEQRVAALGIADRVQFAGAQRDVARYVAAADVLAAPSRNEGMGRALVEAMALGVPVVASAVGGIPDVVTDGHDGWLVPAGDPAALALALAELGSDPARAAKLGAAAVEASTRFSTEVAEARLLALYDELARARRLG